MEVRAEKVIVRKRRFETLQGAHGRLENENAQKQTYARDVQSWLRNII